jgi:hypothetical protein
MATTGEGKLRLQSRPALTKFLIEFQNFESINGDQALSSHCLKTNSFWIYQTMFIPFGGPQALRASSLAIKIIELVEDPDSKFEEPSEDTKALYGLLVSLWAVVQGYSMSVLLRKNEEGDQEKWLH